MHYLEFAAYQFPKELGPHLSPYQFILWKKESDTFPSPKKVYVKKIKNAPNAPNLLAWNFKKTCILGIISRIKV